MQIDISYDALKLLIKIVVIVLFVGFFFIFGGVMFLHIVHYLAHRNDMPHMTFGSYRPLICENAYQTEDHHYETQNPPYIDSPPLTEGCFSGFIGIPKKWKSWQTQMRGSNAGDWVAEWYAGWNAPVGPFTQAQINSGRINFNNVGYTVRFQGKGALRIYRITGDMNSTSAPSGKRQTTEPEKDPPPILPHSGANKDYSFVLEQCERNGEAIDCWGYATNKTDAATRHLHFKDSHAQDDEGHPFFLGIITGGFRFDNGFQQKLLPGAKTRFYVRVADPHMNVKKVTLALNVSWAGRYDSLIFNDVPVQ
jgi:hypothetical protein